MYIYSVYVRVYLRGLEVHRLRNILQHTLAAGTAIVLSRYRASRLLAHYPDPTGGGGLCE